MGFLPGTTLREAMQQGPYRRLCQMGLLAVLACSIKVSLCTITHMLEQGYLVSNRQTYGKTGCSDIDMACAIIRVLADARQTAKIASY